MFIRDQGDPPDDSKAFWTRIMSKTLSSISKFNFCIFAMGDSSYTKFNWIGLQLARRFEQLGCNLIFPVVSCDERHELGYDFTADVGIAQLSEYAIQHEIGDFNNVIQYKPRFPICSSQEIQISKGVKSSDSNFVGKVLINDRVTAEDHFQETRLIRFSIEGSYDPGDVINIKPCNPDGYVDMVFDAFDQWDRDSVVSWSSDCTISGLNLPMTLGQLIKEEVDLVGIPRRHFFCILGNLSITIYLFRDYNWNLSFRKKSIFLALKEFPLSQFVFLIFYIPKGSIFLISSLKNDINSLARLFNSARRDSNSVLKSLHKNFKLKIDVT